MRLIAILIFLSAFSAEILAKDNLLLHCLAREEEKLHREKNLSIIYKLNQNFINEFATSNDIAIKKNYVDEICNPKAAFPPSVGLLRILLLKENDVFDLSLTGVDASMRPYKMAYIRELLKQVPHFFISYLAGVQIDMPDAKCLGLAIPEIPAFNERIKYLEEEITIHEILEQKSKIESIFNGLKNLAEIKKNCGKIRPKQKAPEAPKKPKPVLKF
jgi:hypothetical protein